MKKSVKPSTTEEEYFAKEEAEKKRKIHAERHAATTKKERDAAKKLHWMHCPKCGAVLTEVSYRDIKIDKCFGCGGVYLDNGELEHLLGQDHKYLKALLTFFLK